MEIFSQNKSGLLPSLAGSQSGSKNPPLPVYGLIRTLSKANVMNSSLIGLVAITIASTIASTIARLVGLISPTIGLLTILRVLTILRLFTWLGRSCNAEESEEEKYRNSDHG